MKIKLADLETALYTPDNQVWMWAPEESLGLYRSDKNRFERWTLGELLSVHGEVSTEPYPREFKVGDRITTAQEAIALPVSAVILDHNNSPLYKANHGWWYRSGTERPFLNSRLNFPATVLWLPEENNQ